MMIKQARRLKLIVGVLLAHAAIPVAVSRAENFYGLTTTNGIVTFSSNAPASLSAPVAVTGLQGGESLFAVDASPSDGTLYALGSVAASTGRLYRVNPATGAATLIGSSFAMSGNGGGIDVSPVTGFVRIVAGAAGQNFRMNPATGTLLTDTNLAYAAGDPNFGLPTAVYGIAYTNNFPGATATTLFDFDLNGPGNRIARQGGPDGNSPSPNAGQLTTISTPSVDTGSGINLGLDVASDGTAYLLLRDPPTNLYTLDFASGTATSLGQIGNGADTTRDIAVFPVTNVVQFSASSYSASEETGSATITIARSNPFGTASVNYATSNGSAQAPADYTAVSGTATFTAGATTTTFAVPVADDGKAEGGETVDLALSSPSGGVASLASPSTALLTLVSNPSPLVSGLRFKPAAFFANYGTGNSITKRKRKAMKGSRVSYKLSEAATMSFAVE